MKKKNLFFALAAGMVMFSACSNDDDIVNNGGNGQDDAQVQSLVLQIASSGDGLTTRAGRPLYSNEAAQDIQKVALYFVNDENKVVLKKLVDWNNAVDYTDGKQLEISMKKENNQKLPDDTYTVYAVGYSSTSDYTNSPALPANDEGTADGTDTWDAANFNATITYNINKNGAEEIFAGELTNLVVADGAFSLKTDGTKNTITLHRQVAGVTGYFTNIPVSVNGKNSQYLRLVATNNSDKVKFTDFNTTFTQNGNQGSTVWYIVNGEKTSSLSASGKFADGTTDAYTLYEINLENWFKNTPQNTGDYKGYDYNEDGFLGYQDIQKYLEDNGGTDYSAVWVNKNGNDNQSLVRGSVFDGKFVIPFEKVSQKQTLQLQLLDKSKNILKYWNINVKQGDLHTATSGSATTERVDENTSVYNIYRNHMYNVGMKEATNPGTPDPEKPTDPEKPEDLSKGQDLIIQVNDNWEVIHQMEID